MNTIAKESKNIGATKNNDILKNAGLHLLGEKIKKGISSVTSPAITLTNNEIKNIKKIIKSVENKVILLKGTATKITTQKAGYLNFFRPLTTTNVPLMKSNYSIN